MNLIKSYVFLATAHSIAHVEPANLGLDTAVTLWGIASSFCKIASRTPAISAIFCCAKKQKFLATCRQVRHQTCTSENLTYVGWSLYFWDLRLACAHECCCKSWESIRNRDIGVEIVARMRIQLQLLALFGATTNLDEDDTFIALSRRRIGWQQQ